MTTLWGLSHSRAAGHTCMHKLGDRLGRIVFSVHYSFLFGWAFIEIQLTYNVLVSSVQHNDSVSVYIGK